MRIDYLKIPANRNLRNFEIDFDQKAPLTVLLGQNGSGKSNLIENLIEIFLNLEKAETASFAYEIKYYCYGRQIEITADPQAKRDRLHIVVDGKTVKATTFRRDARDYLPAHIFAYYSGTNTRMEKLFAEPTKKYYRDNLYELQGRSSTDSDGLRRFFLCRKEYAELAFLALFLDKSEFAKFIRCDRLRFESFDSTLFVLKTPWWSSRKNQNDFFWGAKGSFTEFMERLRGAALAPIKNEESLEFDVRGRTQKIERLYLYIENPEQLNQLQKPYESTKLMFNHLESMYLSDLLEEVRVNGQHESGQSISVRQLSEGERQLVMVFGLMLFTHEDEVLYLLDEPDSHLNPRWVYDYMDWLGQAFQEKEGLNFSSGNPLLESTEPTIPGASQVILATHNPLMIGTLRKNQVRIMSQTPEGTIAPEPDFDPIGIGVEGLMKTELFGLRSTLAPEILEKIDRQYVLLGKENKTPEENIELIRLGFELNDLGIARTHPNPYFEQFAVAMAKRTPTPEIMLSNTDIAEQNKLANEILAEILEEEKIEQAGQTS
jgi:predicted ATPase